MRRPLPTRPTTNDIRKTEIRHAHDRPPDCYCSCPEDHSSPHQLHSHCTTQNENTTITPSLSPYLAALAFFGSGGPFHTTIRSRKPSLFRSVATTEVAVNPSLSASSVPGFFSSTK